jgi:ubiquinone/menaquinone biosynthesis C-methylase UbiE
METAPKHDKNKYIGFGSSPPPPPRKREGLVSRKTMASVVVLVVAAAVAALFLPSSHALSIPQIQSFYNAVGPMLDIMSVLEDKPRSRAVQHAQLSTTCTSVLEIGSGTGRTAEKVLQEYSNIKSYTCVEVSSRMAELTRKRLETYTDNCEIHVLQQNALATPWPSVDCILAFYVLDIMNESDIHVFLSKARESLQNSSGKVVLVSITMPPPSTGIWGRVVMGTWQWTASRVPLLVGGCRPIELMNYLKKDEWKVQEYETKSVFGYTSEIAIASPRKVTNMQ